MYTERKLNEIIDPEIAEFISANRQGYGLWIWKPLIVLDFLRRNPTCESILYLDAGCDFNYSKSSNKRWQDYISNLKRFDAIIFQTSHTEDSYTSEQLVMRLRSEPTHLQSGQIHAGAFFMNRSFADKFCKEWLGIMLEEQFKYLRVETIGQSENLYRKLADYRHDQSVFSLLMKKEQNIKTLQDVETDFSPLWKAGLSFPILASRNRSIVPILKVGLVHRALRRVERRVIRTHNSCNEYNRKRKLKRE